MKQTEELYLLKPITIPAGTKFTPASTETKRYGDGHFESIIGLSKDTSGSITYFVGGEGSVEKLQMEEFFSPFPPTELDLPDGGEWPPKGSPKEELIMTAKGFRVDLDATLQMMKALRDELMGCSLEGVAVEPREVIPNLILSIRHVEDAIMRQGLFLKAVGNPNPYPKSYDPTSPVVEPTADGLTL